MPKFDLSQVRKALKETARFANTSKAGPVIMTGYLINYQGETLRVSCANGESWHSHVIIAEKGSALEAWAIVIDVAVLRDSVELMIGKLIEIEYEFKGGKPRLSFKVDTPKSPRLNLIGMPPYDFPLLDATIHESVIVGGKEEMGEDGQGEGTRDFARMIRSVTFAAQDETDADIPIYRAVRVELDSQEKAGISGVLRLTALDNLRYAQAWGHIFTDGALSSMTVPAKFLADVGRGLDLDAPTTIGARLTDGDPVAIVIQNGSRTWASSLFEAAYPNVAEITPSFVREVVVEAREFRSFVKSLRVISAEDVAVLRISKDGIAGRALAPETGDTWAEMDVLTHFDRGNSDAPLFIALSMKLMADALAAQADAGKLSLWFAGADKGVMLMDAGANNWAIFQMPVTQSKARSLGLPTKDEAWERV